MLEKLQKKTKIINYSTNTKNTRSSKKNNQEKKNNKKCKKYKFS